MKFVLLIVSIFASSCVVSQNYKQHKYKSIGFKCYHLCKPYGISEFDEDMGTCSCKETKLKRRKR